jgi:hypothetical protein
MNIHNIASLAEQLQILGFEIASSSLLKRICFKPVSFIISQKVDKGKDQLRFHLFFERESGQSSYDLNVLRCNSSEGDGFIRYTDKWD